MDTTNLVIACTKGSTQIEEIKRFLREDKLLDTSKRISHDEQTLYFPLITLTEQQLKQVNEKIENNDDITITEKEMPQKASRSLKDHLKDKIPQSLLPQLKTAYDTVGTIAIMEIDPELIPYQDIIGNTLLTLQKNITTVLKKSGIHSGVFRTQQLDYVAGINTKVAEYKENNVVLTLDVEQVYFSPRLSTERKRIIGEIHPGENVLVMFSGCGPYVATIAKNTQARWVTGIEINPVGHSFALKNMHRNKLANTSLYCGDVKAIIPTLRRGEFGIKSDWPQDYLDIKLKENPDIVEFFFAPYDLVEHLAEIRKMIDYCARQNKGIFLHIPLKYKEGVFSLVNPHYRQESVDVLLRLNDLATHYAVHGIVVHPIENEKEDISTFISVFNELKPKLDCTKIYFENLPFKGFGTPEEINDVLTKTGISNLCLDIGHSYIIHKSETELLRLITENKAENIYFHLMDTKGIMTREGDHLPFGAGDLDFEKIVPYAERGMLEIREDDYMNPIKSIASFKKLNELRGNPSFDRILMPLPKSAEDFLEDAFKVIKKGTVIHFYDFLYETEIPQIALDKIERVAKEKGVSYHVAGYTKCGQYAPQKYRICVDIIIDDF